MKPLLVVLISICLLMLAKPIRAQEAIDQEEPIPTSVDEITSPMERTFEKKPLRQGFFPWVKEQLKEYPPFLRDTKLLLNLRSYYMRRNNYNYDDSLDQAWAMGGFLSYTSGLLFDRISVGATLYTSQPVYAPKADDGTNLLAPGQQGFTVPGQLYGRVKLFEGTFLNLYRYGDYNSPYLSKDDGRMAPYTFEGYTVKGSLGGTDGTPRLDFGGGYILKIKDKNAVTFDWMSEKAGATAKRGVATLGGRYSHGGFSLGAIDYYSDDIINIGYAETTYTVKLTDDLGLRFAAQFTDQRSTGSNLLTGAHFATNQVGLKTDLSYRAGILSLAYTTNSRGYDLQNPWSGYPGYTSAMDTDNKKAGVAAIAARISYDFSRLGLEGVAAYLYLTHGWGMVDQTTKAPLPDENVIDTDLQWRPTWSYLKGLWVRGRYGVVHQYQGSKQYTHDGRIIVNYDLQLM
jgi:hypothetical protein